MSVHGLSIPPTSNPSRFGSAVLYGEMVLARIKHGRKNCSVTLGILITLGGSWLWYEVPVTYDARVPIQFCVWQKWDLVQWIRGKTYCINASNWGRPLSLAGSIRLSLSTSLNLLWRPLKSLILTFRILYKPPQTMSGPLYLAWDHNSMVSTRFV